MYRNCLILQWVQKQSDIHIQCCERLLIMDRKLKENSKLLKEINGNWYHNANRQGFWKWPSKTAKINKGHMSQVQTKDHIRKDCPISTSSSQPPDQSIPVKSYSPPITVTQTVTASYTVPQSSLVTILQELNAMQMNYQLRKMSEWHKQNKSLPCSQW